MNQLFQSIYDQVISNTNRPNLVEETKLAISQETLTFHNRGQFRSDVREAVLTSTNGNSLTYKFTIPKDKRIRKILGVRPLTSLGQYGRPLKKMDIFDSPSCRGHGYSWMAGTLQINLPHPALNFAVSYLEFPELHPDRYSSWIAQTYPHYIADAATARVLILREKNQAQYYMARVGEAAAPGTHIFNLLNENEEVEEYECY